MIYFFPPYIEEQRQPSSSWNYLWMIQGCDSDYFQYNPNELIDKIENATTWAKNALCAGIYEWIIWRFHSLSDGIRSFQVAEAALVW